MKRRKITDENIKVGSIAREEMAIERDRILRRKRASMNPFEEAAEKWKKESEKEEEKKFAKEKESPDISIREVSLEGKLAQEDETMEWKPLKWQERGKEREIGTKNAASIWVLARKLMAKEWARALGKKIEDPLLYTLEEQARSLEEKKKDEERKIQEAEKARQDALRERALKKKLLREKKKEEERKAKEAEKARQDALRERALKKKLLIEKKKEEKASILRSANWAKTDKQMWDRRVSEWVKKKIKK